MAEYQKAHALIVGGGLAGVATAIALARHGHKVTLLEGGSEFTEVRIITFWLIKLRLKFPRLEQAYRCLQTALAYSRTGV